MNTNFRTDATSVPSSFLLLAMVAGIFYFELFESETASYHDQQVNHRMELVFHPKPPSQRPALFITEDTPHSDVVAPSSNFNTKCFPATEFVVQRAAKNYTGPVLSSHNPNTSFNIPHVNSDEDGLFYSPEDVA